MKRWVPFLISLSMLSVAILACSLPSPSVVAQKGDSISTVAAQTVEQIKTQAGTLNAVQTQAAGTVIGDLTKLAKTPNLILPKVTLNKALLPRLNTPQAAGSISGTIHHSGVADAMRIYWREVNSGKVGYIETGKTDTTYTITGLAVGDYNIVSWYWPQGASGAVTTTNIITANGAAEQHTCEASLRKIHLDAGQTVTGADIGCWGGNFFFLVTPAAP
jgi:hypothetical protein